MANTNPDPWLIDPVPVLAPAAPVAVYRVEVDDPGDGTAPTITGLTLLPGVECLAVRVQEGPDPGTAVFRYRFDGSDSSSPQSAEQALSTSFTTDDFPHLVEVGDRLAVRATRHDGGHFWLFDGFPMEWECTLIGSTEEVTMTASGVGKRLWDTPIGGAVWRENDEPEAVNDVVTGLVPRFNPKGLPNCSPSTADSGADPHKYPVFMDENVKGTDTDSNDYPRTWTLPLAVAYLLYRHNAEEAYVTNPARSDLDDLLVGREPIDDTPYDPTDPGAYTAKPIAATDAPLTGKALPIAVHDQVQDYGFGVRFRLSADGDSGYPTTAIELFLKQAGNVKSVYLASRLSDIDAGSNNVGAAQLARDLSGVVNHWTVDGAVDRWEFDAVLAPGYPSSSSDSASASALAAFNKANLTQSTSDKYRLWVLDEDGSGHYANGSTSLVSGTATSLDDVFGDPEPPPDDPDGDPVPLYVKRRRPPVGELFTQDSNGKPLSARLWVSTDYSGSKPGVWDGTGTWREVTGGWELLKDRIGIRVTAENPNGWDIGKSDSAPFKSGDVKIVQCIGNPDATNPAFFLRLTCVVESDQALAASAARQSTSPISYPVQRRIDARDRYAVQTIHYPSQYNQTGGGSDVTARDDTDLAQAEADAARTATEAGVFEGEVEVPYLTTYYELGDKIDEVNGRGLGLRTDTGGTGYLPVLPIVTGVHWVLSPGQKTVLSIGDSGHDRRKLKIRGRRKPRQSGSVTTSDLNNAGRVSDYLNPNRSSLA